MIKELEKSDLMTAAIIHSESWKDSHKEICSSEFIAIHTPERQEEYLRKEMKKGKKIYILIDKKPFGIVSVYGNLIENLYVLPTEQNKGYGTQLLKFAVRQCVGVPSLWILGTNNGAKRLYERYGFNLTGNINKISDKLCEYELSLK